MQTVPCTKCGNPIPQSSVVVSNSDICWRCNLNSPSVPEILTQHVRDEPEHDLFEVETIYDRDVRAVVAAMIGLAKHTPGVKWADLITHSESIALEMQEQRNKRKGIEDK